MFESEQFGHMLPNNKIYMTCYEGFLRPDVELSWEKEFFEWDTAVLDSGSENDHGIPHYVTSLSMLNKGMVNPIVVWAEERAGTYNIYPGRSRYFCWRTLHHIDAPIVLIDRFSHPKTTHRQYFSDLNYMKEDLTLDLVSGRTKHADGYVNQHEAWLRPRPEENAFDNERQIFATEWDLNGLPWRKAKRWNAEDRFPDYFKALNEKQGLDFYYNDAIKYRWGNNTDRRRVDITCMKDGTDVLLPHIGIEW